MSDLRITWLIVKLAFFTVMTLAFCCLISGLMFGTVIPGILVVVAAYGWGIWEYYRRKAAIAQEVAREQQRAAIIDSFKVEGPEIVGRPTYPWNRKGV